MIAARDIDQGELAEFKLEPSYSFCICVSIFIAIHIYIFRRADLQRGSPGEGPQPHSHHAALPRVPQGKRELQEACSQVIMQRPASNLTQQRQVVSNPTQYTSCSGGEGRLRLRLLRLASVQPGVRQGA